MDLEDKKNKPRLRFSNEAYNRLMVLYQSGVHKPGKLLREQLAKELDKTPRSIQIWFQNKRAKAKRQPDNSSEKEDRKKGLIPSPLDLDILPKNCFDINSAVPMSGVSFATSLDSPIRTFNFDVSYPSPTREGLSESVAQVFGPNHVAPVSYVRKPDMMSGFNFNAGLQNNVPFPSYFDECLPLTPVSPIDLKKRDASSFGSESSFLCSNDQSMESLGKPLSLNTSHSFLSASVSDQILPSGHVDQNLHFGPRSAIPPEECFTNPALFMKWVMTNDE